MAGYKDIQPRWQAGQSGNPAGRPKGSRNRATLMREVLALQLQDQHDLVDGAGMLTVEDIITLAQAAQAIKGSTAAYVALMDSAYGKPARNR